MPARLSSKPGMPGGRTPLAGTTRSLSTTSDNTCLSIALANARRALGSWNGGAAAEDVGDLGQRRLRLQVIGRVRREDDPLRDLPLCQLEGAGAVGVPRPLRVGEAAGVADLPLVDDVSRRVRQFGHEVALGSVYGDAEGVVVHHLDAAAVVGLAFGELRGPYDVVQVDAAHRGERVRIERALHRKLEVVRGDLPRAVVELDAAPDVERVDGAVVAG